MGICHPKPEPTRIQDHPPGGIVEALRKQIAEIEKGSHKGGEEIPISSGCEPLDRLLPEHGFRQGTLVGFWIESNTRLEGLLTLINPRSSHLVHA